MGRSCHIKVSDKSWLRYRSNIKHAGAFFKSGKRLGQKTVFLKSEKGILLPSLENALEQLFSGPQQYYSGNRNPLQN